MENCFKLWFHGLWTKQKINKLFLTGVLRRMYLALKGTVHLKLSGIWLIAESKIVTIKIRGILKTGEVGTWKFQFYSSYESSWNFFMFRKTLREFKSGAIFDMFTYKQLCYIKRKCDWHFSEKVKEHKLIILKIILTSLAILITGSDVTKL